MSIHKKEFQILKYKSGIKLQNMFQLASQQLFVARWMVLNDVKCLFLKHKTGSGKTMSSLYSAKEFLELYKLLNAGRVIIIGYQKSEFYKEMLTQPELGFVSRKEYEMSQELMGEERKQFINQLKKRINYVKFYGYQELFNALFLDPESDKLDEDILNLFANSFVICDEIHNVYNSANINSYGRALKAILNHFRGKPEQPKCLFLSATPINNKPREIIDIIMLLTGREYKFDELFANDTKLTVAGLSRIKDSLTGYFSFYNNEDTSVMPVYRFIGDSYGCDYLRFIKCELTESQKRHMKDIPKIKFEDRNIYDAAFGDFYKTSDLSSVNTADLKFNGEVVSGPGLSLSKLSEYSKKYHEMLLHLFESRGKVIIFHDYVHGTGIKFIEQILIANGYINENGIVTENVRCICGKLKSQHISSKTGECAEFRAARYLMLFGELDARVQEQRLTDFNSYNNRNGEYFKILIGSEYIREGKNFKAVANIFVMNLMKHISALLQLIGRAVRMYSHEGVDPRVQIKIFATLNEIEKYRVKIARYKTVQLIEKVIHETAVDAHLFYDINKKTATGNLGILPYTLPKQAIRVDKSTYDVFYGDWEVEEIKKIITALFLQSPAWTRADLLRAVRDPPFIQYMDFSQISDKNFVMALGDLIYGINEPIIKNNIYHKIYPVHNGEIYYVLFPLEQTSEKSDIGIKLEQQFGNLKIDFLSWLQTSSHNNMKILVHEDISMLNNNYGEMKDKFYKKFHSVSFLEIPRSSEIYGVEFHMKLIEECIEYVFKISTREIVKSEYHEFYFKMLHYYKHLDLVIYADMLNSDLLKIYDKYLTSKLKSTSGSKSDDVENIIKSNISSSVSSFDMSEINQKLTQKVTADRLPVGHMLHVREPKMLTEQGWYHEKNFVRENAPFVENDIIIGYYEVSENSINFKFKLRKPVQKISEKRDKREQERGVSCESKKKEELISIAKQLGVVTTGTNVDLCENIKKYLLYAELKDRNKYRKGLVTKRTRYCYLTFEALNYGNS